MSSSAGSGAGAGAGSGAYVTPQVDGVSSTADYVGKGRLEGKVCVVTGGGGAIGGTVCEVFAKEGGTVYFCDRGPDPGTARCKAIVDAGGRSSFEVVDVCDTPALKEWIDGVGEKEGRIDVLIPNAAAFVFGHIEEVDDDAWDKVLKTNVVGYANCAKFALPWMRKTGAGGSIVNMASVSSHIAQPAFVPYNTSKGAIMQLTRCLALDLGPEGIRVNAVCPGTIDTPATSLHAAKLGITKAELVKAQCETHAIKRLGSTLDVALAMLFLASDESKFVTGSHLDVDGGYMIR